MRVSHSELYAVCKKVFEGLGFPHGVDEDAAFMVSWVELHGLEGLDRLRIALPALLADRSPARLELLSEDSHSAVIDARGASALAVSPAAIDMASALAAEDRPAHVELRNCGDEIFAVAPAVRASELRGQRFEIRWSGGGEDYVFAGRDRNSSCLNVRSGGSGRVVDRAGLIIRCTCVDLDGSDASQSATVWTHRQSLAHRESALRDGIEIDNGFWRELTTLARRVFVPASETSRIRGAGSAAADD